MVKLAAKGGVGHAWFLGFHHHVDEICAFFSVFLNPLKMGPVGCPETSVRNYHYMPRIKPKERR
jgi:hypothetical protein